MKVYFRTSSSQIRRKGFSCTVTASGNCGTVNRVSRIVGGVETEVNEYPWQAAFVHNGTNDVICGAVLLADKFIVTTSSCIVKINGSDVDVLFGAHDLNNPTEFQQRVPVPDLPWVTEFNKTSKEFDFVGFPINPVNLTDRVKPVCLPDSSKNYSGSVAVTTGWGSVSEGGPSSSVLNEVEVVILTREECDSYYPGRILDRMICAGYPEGGKDRCTGDTGGPLVVRDDDGRWVLLGLASWGDGCGQPNAPGVYFNILTMADGLLSQLPRYTDSLACDNIYGDSLFLNVDTEIQLIPSQAFFIKLSSVSRLWNDLPILVVESVEYEVQSCNPRQRRGVHPV
ncbi:serine protease 33-like [Palaemon carinicauda]|uniref:serine protease 33-like n=1 Tax=Palaemon carinicauda TaxID=392227 RepID=UPI0035B668E8